MKRVNRRKDSGLSPIEVDTERTVKVPRTYSGYPEDEHSCADEDGDKAPKRTLRLPSGLDNSRMTHLTCFKVRCEPLYMDCKKTH